MTPVGHFFYLTKQFFSALYSLDLQDQIELSFMFRTSQSRALLLYMHDTPGTYINQNL